MRSLILMFTLVFSQFSLAQVDGIGHCSELYERSLYSISEDSIRSCFNKTKDSKNLFLESGAVWQSEAWRPCTEAKKLSATKALLNCNEYLYRNSLNDANKCEVIANIQISTYSYWDDRNQYCSFRALVGVFEQ